ncbi:hypothetical protein F1536_00560 [Achromobacter xylosoxidans]|uniref:hypothetical protein n=1 Tax=Alcaligenes xylosoxydans xylosoxydans TaxID=85698 RepID=UPI0012324B5E|nr:hypothetical protein [Achromobacter xylosoxidans]KAA5924219.1 hypothetical protein F1536_00560 [Achromobacter xylosoxidans]
MNIFVATRNLASSIPLDPEEAAEFQSIITKFESGCTNSPRDENNDNSNFIRILTLLAQDKAKSLYGNPENADIDLGPFFSQNRWPSRIAFTLEEKFCIELGQSLRTWEDFFYDICHEALHLLNPVKDLKTTTICRLEEGVAVKFAEDCYAAFIYPWKKKKARNSPVDNTQAGDYRRAHAITKKIPDSVLKSIREKFGAFYKSNDPTEIHKLAGSYINEDEAIFLSQSFLYPYPSL